MSEFISLDEMISQAAKACPENTPIPSKSLVRLQFAPRNPYTKIALNFTSKLQVQNKIQRRQLRVTHPDDHYCSAQFKYLKELAIELKDMCTLLFCDDKAKVPFGQPENLVSTGVRGKKTIVPENTTLCALDHDMTNSSLTPSVILNCNIPDSIQSSFVRGEVTTVVNDSVFQQSSPFRHAAVLVKILQKRNIPPVVLKFTDGGTDQRNNLESVKCASLCIFKELNLDFLVLARCAPGHSYTNPAERVMSVLNLGLQNVALSREKCNEDVEVCLKRCNSMAEIRTLAIKSPEIKQAWAESVEPVQRVLNGRFSRLKLKDQPFQIADPATDEDIDILKRHLRELFPDLDLNKLVKSNTAKIATYTSWMSRHSRSRQYTFQLRKCKDPDCCLPPLIDDEQIEWLPDPQLDETGDHYKPYASMKGVDTTDENRPSMKLKLTKEPKAKKQKATDEENEAGPSTTAEKSLDDVDIQQPEPDAHMCTVQNARNIVNCTECEKPRVIYSKHKLSGRQNSILTGALSEYPYTCGGPILPPTSLSSSKVMCRLYISCGSPIEVTYYGSNLGRTDICSYCCTQDCSVDQVRKRKYKTVLPICENCKMENKKTIVMRPFGKHEN